MISDFRALGALVVVIAWFVTSWSLMQTPIYEASAQVWVDQEQETQQTNPSGSGEEIQTLHPKVEGPQMLIPAMIYATDSRPVAEEVIGRLGLKMSPAQLLDNLTIEQDENMPFLILTYKGTDPQKAQQIVNTVGKVSSELISERSAAGSKLTATLYEPAAVPESPVSPDPLRNGLLTLVVGLVLAAGLTLTPTRSLAARSTSELSGRIRAVRQGVGQVGLPGRRHAGTSEAERNKEQELLEALDRRGKLTAVEAALETSLSVGEANRMLFELAVRGYLEVIVEHGKLLYSFWGRGA